ncbi:MAG: hypothetical protein ACRDX9_06995 [Acidimicrobiia bacterium]
MRRLKRPGLAVLISIGLLVAPGAAWAQTDEPAVDVEDTEDRADTLFNFGYDLINRLFVWNLSALDGIYDCTLENGPLTATYGETSSEGVVPVDNLEDDAGVVSFPNRPEEEVADDLEAADAPIEYNGADGDCGVSGGDVSGPNGQVNHGMFMKLFNSLYDGPGRGCVIRHLAQSDLGKDDQQVQAGDVTIVDPVQAGDTGTIDFSSAQADCEHGKKDAGDEVAETEAATQGGKPDHAGKPDSAGKPDQTGSQGSPGNSGSAPGHNK